MATLLILALLLPLLTKADNCDLAWFNSQTCEATCFQIGGNPTTYRLNDTSLTINDIAAICPSVQIAQDLYFSSYGSYIGYGCEYNDLIWPESGCDCPSCPCDTEFTDQYTSFESFFTRACYECSCTDINNGATGYTCAQIGDRNILSRSYTTIDSYNKFECPPQVTCTDAWNQQHLPGDGYWDTSTCDTFCICGDDGQGQCQTGYGNILSGSAELKNAFINRCGSDIQGCIGAPQFIISQNITSDCPTTDCPKCGCATGTTPGDQYTVQEMDYSDRSATVCLSCICITDDDGYEVASCSNDDGYRDARSCPSNNAPNCYFGISAETNVNRATYAPTTGQCPSDTNVCGFTQKSNIFDPTMNEWGCVDTLLCDALGATGTCVSTSGAITPSYFGCGFIDTFSWTESMYCGAVGDYTNNVNGDVTCSNSPEWDEVFGLLFNCMLGEGMETGYHESLRYNYNMFKCMNIPEFQDDNPIACSGGVYNVMSYLKWVYGCPCKAASYLYNLAGTDKQRMENEKDDLIKNMASFAGENLPAWEAQFNCNIGSLECDLSNGEVKIMPSNCDAAWLTSWFTGECVVLCQDPNSGEYDPFNDPKDILTFPQIANQCGNVKRANESGLCNSMDDLIWPDDGTDSCCPYCKCDTEGNMASIMTNEEWFFGQQCATCECSKRNAANELGVECIEYGDGNFSPFDGTTSTVNSFKMFQCPPQDENVCENDGDYYITGQTFYNSTSDSDDVSDQFCLCNEYNGATQIECVDGTKNILESNNDELRKQFLLKCGEDIAGCLEGDRMDNILERSFIYTETDEHVSCPMCGCSSGASVGDTFNVEEEDIGFANHFRCKSCQCLPIYLVDDDFDSSITLTAVSCPDDSDPYMDTLTEGEQRTCPPSEQKSCYVGISTEDGSFANAITNKGTCHEEGAYCGWEYNSNVFETEYSWGCNDRISCELFGVSDGTKCISGAVNLTYGFGCGLIEQYLGTDTIEMNFAMQCYPNEDSNNKDIEVDSCENNEDYKAFMLNLQGCIFGTDSVQFACPDDGQYTDVSCDNLKRYYEWVKGCSCNTAKEMMDLAVEKNDQDLIDYLNEKVDMFLKTFNGISAQNPDEWNDDLNCGWITNCNLTTGVVTIDTAQPTASPTAVAQDSPEGVTSLCYVVAVLISIGFAIY